MLRLQMLAASGTVDPIARCAPRRWRWMAALLCAATVGFAAAQPVRPATAASQPMSEHDVDAWLARLQQASRKRNYVGTFVVSSASAGLGSARIWHVCQGEQQIERVETLSGPPRSVIRHDDQVLMLLPQKRVARLERRESLGAFPGLLKSLDTTITNFYSAVALGVSRVAGFDADVVHLIPKDRLRFGYRVWSDQESALVLKVQTLDASGEVLEQAAFSELRFDAPLSLDQLARMMEPPDGWSLEKPVLKKTTAQALGWTLEQPLPGFKPVQCYERTLGNGNDPPQAASAAPGPDAAHDDSAMHCVFSDGLASVSLFVEPYGARAHRQPGQMTLGATHTLMRRISGTAAPAAADATQPATGDWWLTAVGEVPLRTLQLFGDALQRVKPPN